MVVVGVYKLHLNKSLASGDRVTNAKQCYPCTPHSEDSAVAGLPCSWVHFGSLEFLASPIGSKVVPFCGLYLGSPKKELSWSLWLSLRVAEGAPATISG